MKDGFIKVAAATPEVRVADVEFNTDTAIEYIKTAERHGAKLIVLPELGLTAYTCGDLFLQTDLIRRAEQSLLSIAAETAEYDILAVVGLPVSKNGKLYNCSAFLKDGEILGFVPKTYIPNYGEFYERRHFNTLGCNTTVFFGGRDVPIGNKLIFAARNMPEFSVAAEICEDVWRLFRRAVLIPKTVRQSSSTNPQAMRSSARAAGAEPLSRFSHQRRLAHIFIRMPARANLQPIWSFRDII